MTDLEFVHKKDGTTELRQDALKTKDHMRAKDMEQTRSANALDDMIAQAALDKENPLMGSAAPTPPSGGQGKRNSGSDPLKPQVFNANNHYQKTPRNLLPGMDTPIENLEDNLVLKGSGAPTGEM
jgi:hypothetical protein